MRACTPPVPIFMEITDAGTYTGILHPEDPEEAMRCQEAAARASDLCRPLSWPPGCPGGQITKHTIWVFCNLAAGVPQAPAGHFFAYWVFCNLAAGVPPDSPPTIFLHIGCFVIWPPGCPGGKLQNTQYAKKWSRTNAVRSRTARRVPPNARAQRGPAEHSPDHFFAFHVFCNLPFWPFLNTF